MRGGMLAQVLCGLYFNVCSFDTCKNMISLHLSAFSLLLQRESRRIAF